MAIVVIVIVFRTIASAEQQAYRDRLVEAEVNICGGILRNFSPYQGAPTWARIEEALLRGTGRGATISGGRSIGHARVVRIGDGCTPA